MTDATHKHIPQDVQIPIRTRLRTLRQLRGFNITDLTSFGSGTLTQYELHDLSTMKLRDLYFLSQEIGMSFSELMDCLFSEDMTEEVNPNFRRAAQLLRRLTEREQDTAIELLTILTTHCVDERSPQVSRSAAKSTREILEHAAR